MFRPLFVKTQRMKRAELVQRSETIFTLLFLCLLDVLLSRPSGLRDMHLLPNVSLLRAIVSPSTQRVTASRVSSPGHCTAVYTVHPPHASSAAYNNAA